MKFAALPALVILALAFAASVSARADDEVPNEFRVTVAPDHPIKGDLTGFAQLEFRENPDKKYQTYDVGWPGLNYRFNHWLQISGGLLSLYTDNADSADKLELRPFAGVKFFVPNHIKWTIYNYTRYEYRDTLDCETDKWSAYSRVRSRFGVEVPLASLEKAWEPKTWYALADVEPIYRFDHDTIDPVYVRGGVGYVLSDRVRLELVYWAEFSRDKSGSLEFAQNTFQLNVHVGMSEGLLRRLRNPRAED